MTSNQSIIGRSLQLQSPNFIKPGDININNIQNQNKINQPLNKIGGNDNLQNQLQAIKDSAPLARSRP